MGTDLSLGMSWVLYRTYFKETRAGGRRKEEWLGFSLFFQPWHLKLDSGCVLRKYVNQEGEAGWVREHGSPGLAGVGGWTHIRLCGTLCMCLPWKLIFSQCLAEQKSVISSVVQPTTSGLNLMIASWSLPWQYFTSQTEKGSFWLSSPL